MNMFGTIQTDTYVNVVALDEIAPGLIDESTVGLKTMRHMYIMLIELLGYLESLLIEGGGERKWFACMPDDRDVVGEKGG